MLSTTPKGPFYLNHPVVHRQSGADHVDVRCGRRPLPLGERTFRGGAGGVECESVGCGVSVLGTRQQAERKSMVDTQASGMESLSTTCFINILGQTLLTL